jgi:hypothetical protein
MSHSLRVCLTVVRWYGHGLLNISSKTPRPPAGRERGSGVIALSCSYESVRSWRPVPLLLLGVVAGSTFIDVLLSLPLALGVIEDRPHRLFAGGEVGGNV